MGWQTIHDHRLATSFAPNAEPRTIDFALANAQFLLHVRQPQVLQSNVMFPPHVPLSWAMHSDQLWYRAPPRHRAFKEHPNYSAEVATKAQQAFQELQHGGLSADEAWQRLWTVWQHELRLTDSAVASRLKLPELTYRQTDMLLQRPHDFSQAQERLRQTDRVLHTLRQLQTGIHRGDFTLQQRAWAGLYRLRKHLRCKILDDIDEDLPEGMDLLS
eukprot:6462594-Amphidinium_carterae.1